MPTCKCKPMQRRPPPKAGRTGLLAVLGGVAGLLLLVAGYLWSLGGTVPPRSATIGGPFTLMAAGGQTVTDQSFRGRYVLVYFGYTSCQDVCPLTLDAVADALVVLGPKAERVQPLFVTVDPQRDTPEILGRYVAGFTPRLLGLTGTAAQLRQMQQNYRVTSIVHPGSAGSVGYTIDHSSVLYLLGPDGRYLAPVRADESGAEMAHDIARHLS
jgi:protein SCO1/2